VIPDRQFRELVMAFYRRMRRAGLTRIGARDVTGELVNAAHDIDLFDIQRDLRLRDLFTESVEMMTRAAVDLTDPQRFVARQHLPEMVRALDDWDRRLEARAAGLRQATALQVIGTYGTMRRISTGRHGPQTYRCQCGWEGSNAHGFARQHANTCLQARQPWPVGA